MTDLPITNDFSWHATDGVFVILCGNVALSRNGYVLEFGTVEEADAEVAKLTAERAERWGREKEGR